MGIGASLFLIATGLILALAVGDGSYILGGTFEVTTAGWILAIVGVLGLVISMIFWSGARRAGNTTVIDRERERVV